MDATLSPAAGFDPVKLEQGSAPLKMAIEAGDLAGGVTLVWRRGEIADVQTLGLADIADRRPMARDTLFRIASMTKPVTSVAALMLLEAGAWALDDPITRWAPEFSNMRVLRRPDGPVDDTEPAARAINLEDLLTHRSGLAYGFTSVGPIAHAHEAALGDILTADMDPDEWMKALARLPLTFQPGERFHYSLSTDVLGLLVGRVAGMGFREFLFERIFRPLGMADTDFYIPPEKRGRAAVVYRGEVDKPLEPLLFRRADAPPRFCGGGGGLVSTADDYLAFARMLLNGGEADGVRLLKPETVAMMRTNRLSETQRTHDFLGMPFWASQGFGLGLSMIMDPVRHAWMGEGRKGAFGWPGAFGTWWQADPAEKMILIYLIQDALPLGPEAVANMGQNNQRLGARLALPLWQKQVYAALGDGGSANPCG